MRPADEITTVHDAVVISGRALVIVQEVVAEFLNFRARHKPDRLLSPEAAAVLHRLSRKRRVSRDEVAADPLDAAVSEVTTAEAADILGISPDGVRQRLRRGTLTGRRTPDGWLIPTRHLGGVDIE
ncbi:hypothetical protein [Rhodococcus pyridinivorans]|uniref:hypothetical protein n=1 Tax=Rhodococcus pyridinivorans TaxID=103816 RepID=UPI00110E5EDD|nr:hypothetical protein [Rhodococcus pyridinivorans]